jgi:hypothetical protein
MLNVQLLQDILIISKEILKMNSSRLSLLSLALIAPCMVNAATLQFNFNAS